MSQKIECKKCHIPYEPEALVAGICAFCEDPRPELESMTEPKTNDGGEILQSVEDTLKQRGSRYGEYPKVSHVSQEIKAILSKGAKSAGKSDSDMPDYVWESLDMIANKLSRIVNGDPLYDDNWRDIAGYAQLIVDEINKDSK